jgi:hypothetical protein
MATWAEALCSPAAGHRTIEAVRPVLEDWVGRQHGSLTFHLVQMMTGHGCFGHYLHRVARREECPRCHHCDSLDVTAEHTFIECPAWRRERYEFTMVLGGGCLSLRTMVEAMVGNERSWKAAASFCETVISEKEAAEREREEDTLAAPLRHRREGRRRRAHVALLL